MQAQPQLVAQAPAVGGMPAPNIQQLLAARVASAALANQCLELSGAAAASTAVFTAAVDAANVPRLVLQGSTVFNGTITQGSTVIASFNMDPDGQPAITRDGIVSTDSLAVIQIGADAKTFTVIYVFVADDAIAPPAFLVGSTYALRNKQGRFIKLNLDIVHGIHEAIDAAQQPQGNLHARCGRRWARGTSSASCATASRAA